MIRIPIPSTPDNIGGTIYKLVQLSEIVNNSADENIVLDFRNANFLNALYITGIFSLIENWREAKKTVSIVNVPVKVEGYLDAVYFNGGYNLAANSSLVEDLKRFQLKRFTPIVRFPTYGIWDNKIARDVSINTVVEVILSQIKPSLEYGQALDFLITELSNNVADHSGADFGIIYAQTYPKKGYIDISISDTGIGLLGSYSKSAVFNPKDEIEAVQFALDGSSTKSEYESRGFGLQDSRAIVVKGMNGIFLLWTGKTMVIEKATKRDILSIGGGALYGGCFICLRLPLSPNRTIDLYKLIQH